MKRNLWPRVIFGCYILLMLYLMLIRGRGGSRDVPYWQQVQSHLILQPLQTIGNFLDILLRKEYYLEKFGASYGFQARQAVVNLAGNVVMFVPLGALLPWCAERLRRWWKTMLAAAACITAVELVQLFSLRGTCDMDDLILNLVGVLAGWLLWKLAVLIVKKAKTTH